VIWRFGPVVVYAALAIVIGIAYGGRGLAILSFFYFWAGAWVVFALVWGRAARAAGRWNFRRLDTAPMGDESGGSPPTEGEAVPSVRKPARPQPVAAIDTSL
jgi:hypothetical protein